MALQPSIPTSFVPHEAVQHKRLQTNFGIVFSSFAYLIFGAICLISAGVFFFDRVLDTRLQARTESLLAEGKSVDSDTVDGFIRLRNRLNASKTILNSHVAFSNFFTSLAVFIPENVRFTTLHISLDSAGKAKVDGNGVAKNFNVLSATSAAFSEEDRIKDVIFSKINVNRDSTVSFSISATLDPKIIAYSPDSYVDTNFTELPVAASETVDTTVVSTTTTKKP